MPVLLFRVAHNVFALGVRAGFQGTTCPDSSGKLSTSTEAQLNNYT